MKQTLLALVLLLALAIPIQACDKMWVELMPWTVVERIDDLVVVNELWGIIHLDRQAETFTIRVWNETGYWLSYTWVPSDEIVYPDDTHPVALAGPEFWLFILPRGDYQLRIEARIGLRIWSVQFPIRMK